MQPDASVDAGPAEDAGLPTDAGQTMDAGADAGFDGGAPIMLMDYVPCTLDIDCPSGFGRCLRNLPLHHPDVMGATAVPTASVFRGLSPGQGVCAESCDQDPTVCSTSPNLTRSVSFSCQVVYSGTSPYQLDTASDAGAMRQGVTFAAVCRPPLQSPSFCSACADDAACQGGRCWDFSADAGFLGTVRLGTCIAPCGAGGSCPAGFSCELRGGASGCFPLQATCGACRDLDTDGFGLGFCGAPDSMGNPTVSAVDCDDGNRRAAWLAPLQCGPTDHDCNGFLDAAEMVGTDAFGAQHCTACNDACPTPANANIAGLGFACLGPVGNRACVPACLPGLVDCDANPDCEVGPTTPGRQWAPDVDTDGFSCNAVASSTSCPTVTACVAPVTDAGVYVQARAVSDGGTASTCSNATVCPDADDTRSTIFPGAPERCDGLDNDQDGVVDDGFTTNGDQVCTSGVLPAGAVCATGMRVTIGAACSATCGAITGPGTWRCGGPGGIVCQPNSGAPEVACNGVDDNCNGRIDEPAGDACTRPTNVMPSPCWEAASLQCTAPGGTPVCSQNRALARRPDVPGDAYDSDCDGTDLQADAVFVWSGSVSAVRSGTAAQPFLSLTEAQTVLSARLADAGTATAYLQDSLTIPVVTNATIDLRPGLHLFGGFTGGFSWTPGAVSTRTRVCLPRSAPTTSWTVFNGVVEGLADRAAWVGLRCDRTTGSPTLSSLRDIELDVATDCVGPPLPATLGGWGHSIYGAILRDCDELILENVLVRTGPASDSAPGLTGQTGVSGSRGADLPLGNAGGVGGNGAPAVDNASGQNGSTLPPFGLNVLGGLGGAPNQPGQAPSASMFSQAGARGEGGRPTGPQTILHARPIFPTPLPSLVIAADGTLRAGDPGLDFLWLGAGIGGTGSIGPGGGGGGSVPTSPSRGPQPGGLGGQGGGGGAGGRMGGAGGDNVGLVVLGTQLAPCGQSPLGLAPTLSPCADNVRVTTGSAGAGGQGGVGGLGGSGGNGSTRSFWGTIGGGGGRGCGGGGGAGGRGGSSVAVVHDLASFGAGMLPAWLTSAVAGSAGDGGVGGTSGNDGPGFGSNRCTPTAATGNPGWAGVSLPTALMPLRNCGDARTVDSDRVDGGLFLIVDGAGVPVSTSCP
jgi:hypothetical protein